MFSHSGLHSPEERLPQTQPLPVFALGATGSGRREERGRERASEYCIDAKVNTVKSPLALAGACGGPIQKCRAMLNKHKFTSGSVKVSEMLIILIISLNYSYNWLIFSV